MSELLREWILTVTGAAMLSAFALAVSPEGRCRSVTRLVCGVVMAIALLSPVGKFDFTAYSMSLAAYRDMAAEAAKNAEESENRLSRSIIEEETAAYIWDKAQAAGLAPEEVTVTVKWGDTSCWYPYEVRLRVEAQPGARERLTEILESELGIPRQRQYWEAPGAGQAAEGGD